MASTKKIMIFMSMVMIVFQKSNGVTYTVGDSVGWTSTAKFDYKTWAAIKTFNVGDEIVFVYNKEYHNVVRVTHKNFNLCNTTGPYSTMESGNDTFTIKRPGHFYFICGVPGHCQDGQRVDIRVLQATEPISSPPLSPSKSGPKPAPSSSDSFSIHMGLLKSNLVLSIVVLVLAYGISH